MPKNTSQYFTKMAKYCLNWRGLNQDESGWNPSPAIATSAIIAARPVASHILQRQGHKLRGAVLAAAGRLREGLEFVLQRGKIDSLPITLDLGDERRPVEFVLGDEVDLVLPFAVPPVADLRPLARLNQLTSEIVFKRLSAENGEISPKACFTSIVFPTRRRPAITVNCASVALRSRIALSFSILSSRSKNFMVLISATVVSETAVAEITPQYPSLLQQIPQRLVVGVVETATRTCSKSS